MDFQRDYVLRLIQMMGDLMRRIFEKLEYRERLEMLNDTCRELCGMSLDTGESLAVESLLEMLMPMQRLMMSELLYIKSKASDLPVEEDAPLQLKALRLLASLHEETQLCDLRAQRLADLKDSVFDWLVAEDLRECALFFSQADRYDWMEDSLFQALALAGDEEQPAIRTLSITLLRRASVAPQHTLALCHMTSQELRASAQELEQDIHEQENPQ